MHHLVRQGESVSVLDDLSTGLLKNLDDVRGAIQFERGDVRDDSTAFRVCRSVDYVVHLAAWRAVGRSIDNPIQSAQHNIIGTLTMLEAARRAGVQRFVFASSSAVYGDQGDQSYREDGVPDPRSPYGVTKLSGELFCRLYSRLYGLSTVSLRYFNVYGTYQRLDEEYSLVIPLFIDSLMRGQPAEIHGDGQQKRDFIYIDDVVDATLAAARSSNVEPGGVYNIGSGEATSIRDLYEILERLLGVYYEPHFTSRRIGDVSVTRANISKARLDLTFKPQISLQAGLQRSLTQWLK